MKYVVHGFSDPDALKILRNCRRVISPNRTLLLIEQVLKPSNEPDSGKFMDLQMLVVAPGGRERTEADYCALLHECGLLSHEVDSPAGRLSRNGKPNKDSPCKLSGPFHLVIDQQDRIWISNAVGDTVTRFPASDPTKVDVFKTGGHSGKGMAVDSKGNVWIANTLGAGLTLETKLKLLDLKLRGRMADADSVVLHNLLAKPGLGSVSMLRPDGSPAPGSPFNPGSIWGAWAVSIDGNDHVWVSNFAPGGGVTELCGVRPETCPPGMKTGDPISPRGGYKGGGMQMLVDVSIDPAGNVWVSDNWQDPLSCYGQPDEGVSTRCGGQGMTVFYGLAKPVRSPQIGPARGF